jgi:hypothetical protein
MAGSGRELIGASYLMSLVGMGIQDRTDETQLFLYGLPGYSDLSRVEDLRPQR